MTIVVLAALVLTFVNLAAVVVVYVKLSRRAQSVCEDVASAREDVDHVTQSVREDVEHVREDTEHACENVEYYSASVRAAWERVSETEQALFAFERQQKRLVDALASSIGINLSEWQ